MIQFILGLLVLAVLTIPANLYPPANLVIGWSFGSWLAERHMRAREAAKREEEGL